MGAAFAMVWRPMALMRGAARNKARQLDVLALVGLAVLGLLMWNLTLSGDGRSTGIRFNPWLFRGGFFLTGLATLMVIAAVTHQRAMMGRLLGNPVFNWVGTRSYGMYLYHWPIYQIIRGHAGVPMTTVAVAVGDGLHAADHRGQLPLHRDCRSGKAGSSEWLRGDRRPRTAAAYKRRQRVAGLGIVSAALVGIRRRQHRDGRQPMCRPDRVRQRCGSCRRFDDVGRRRIRRPRSSHHHAPAVGRSRRLTVARVRPTIPPSTAPPTTVLIDKPYFAVGESVMLGAKPVLDARGITTVAEVSKGPEWELEQLRLAKTKYRLTHGVVIQLGTNGTVTQAQYEAVLAEVADVPRVVVMTVKAPKPWIAGNNEIIRALPATHPNVVVLDWEARAEEIAGPPVEQRRRRRASQRRHGQAVLPRHHPRGARNLPT